MFCVSWNWIHFEFPICLTCEPAKFCINHKKTKEIAIVIRKITCLGFKILLTDDRLMRLNRLMTIA